MQVEFVHFFVSDVRGRKKRSTYRRRRDEVEAEGLEVVPLSSEWRNCPEPGRLDLGQRTGWGKKPPPADDEA